jgi:hypothetical protein
VTTLLGGVVYERAYYFCPHCRAGHFPTDQELGLVRKQTLAAQEVIALAGVLDPFEEGARRVLPTLAGLNLSAATVRRTTEDIGEDVAQRRAAGDTFQPPSMDWGQDVQGRRLACVGLDATGVPQQGEHAEKREGRMPWVAAVFNPHRPAARRKRRQRMSARYVSGLMSLKEIGGQLRRECRSAGLAQADVVVGLSDGGAGLEGCLIDAVAGMAREFHLILDFYHAAEHVREFAKALLPDETARRRQVERWCESLKHQGGEALIQELERLDLSEQSAEILESHRLLMGYLRSNVHRTDYPAYVARGWPIGSGAIESACKTVVCQRLKRSGMRWRERGTTALCQLRALYRSDPALWSNYWKTRCPP